jgi:hypothetical protein
MKPQIITHHDWGISPGKRWQAKATLKNNHYTAQASKPAGPLATLIPDARSTSTLLGFDFPIGLPAAYAEAAGIQNFPTFLQSLTHDSDFYQVCQHHSEISLSRPFYPHSPGDKKQSHLLQALSLNHMEHLRRHCDQKQRNRPAAGSLFWTLGANQSGKGAILGWSQVLAPALSSPEVRLWPFDGQLSELLQPDNTVIAETYPTQYHHWLFGKRLSGKANPATRKLLAPLFLNWANENQVILNRELQQQIEAGFPQGDDSLDAFIGLCGMIQTVQLRMPDYEPIDPVTRQVEGWILGQPV